jgi:DNA helicase-2/ATP-dependent DNA helicase PcrA
MEFDQAKMNEAQRQAVEHQNGPMLVLAGAGSGKTRVITHRIARLLSRGIPAHKICALTFTNKAAGEMAERVALLVKEQGLGAVRATRRVDRHRDGGIRASQGGLVLSTFHSFGVMVLSREHKSFGGTFTIFDQGDSISAVKEIMSRMGAGMKLDAAALLARISNAKNAFLSPEEFVVREGDEYDEAAKMIYPRYQAALKNYKAFDFDDLVCEVARMWKSRPDILERWQNEFMYVLVDEYQDTNRAQFELLRLLAGRHKNLCVVGDDDQAIYSWRGASARNILAFEEQFAGAKVIKLEQNYRSTSPILAVANAIIAKRVDAKYTKVLFTNRPGGEKIRLGVAPSPDAEAAFVARELRRLLREEQKKPKEIAILYRSNGQAKLFEEALREQGIPYRMIGGQQFFDRKEIKDILAYLKVLLNPLDEISLRRIMNTPPRGIGDTSMDRLSQTALARGWSLWQAVERALAIDGISSSAREGCRDLERVVTDMRKQLVVEKAKASVVARSLCEAIGLKHDIDQTSTSPSAAARRWANVEGFFGVLARREMRLEEEAAEDASGAQKLMNFLHALTLQGNGEKDDPDNVVTLSTLHGSKGLEFDCVFLVGCEEGLIPHMRTLESRVTDATAQDIEEERRLFYVGITRARQALTLLRCSRRVARGKPVVRTPSRFLSDIPEAMIDSFEIKDASFMGMHEAAQNATNLLAMLDALGK